MKKTTAGNIINQAISMGMQDFFDSQNHDVNIEFCQRIYGTKNKNKKCENKFFLGDNLGLGNVYLKTSEKVDFIYIDPPFFSKSSYKANLKVNKSISIKTKVYDDIWNRDIVRYLRELTSRLYLANEMLKTGGVIALHLDWHVVHYAKIIMDEIFGIDNFINEVIWHYKSGGSKKRSFSKKHDNILIYSKGQSYTFNMQKEKSYNRGLKPYNFKGVSEFEDELGWYTIVNLKDVWNINMVGRTSKERTGYATQKPEELIERLVCTFTNEGDVCCDLFGGSGTLASVAIKNNRNFVLFDKETLSLAMTVNRVLEKNNNMKLYISDKTNIKNKNINIDGSVRINMGDTKQTLGNKEFLELTRISNENPQELLILDYKTSDLRMVVDVFGRMKIERY